LPTAVNLEKSPKEANSEAHLQEMLLTGLKGKQDWGQNEIPSQTVNDIRNPFFKNGFYGLGSCVSKYK
jgi:hypothetical protein